MVDKGEFDIKIIKEKDLLGGEYYMIHTEDIRSKFDLCIEEVNSFEAFCCSYMTEPYFMRATAGNKISDIPKETQWLGIKHTDNTYSIYLSLACEGFRTTLYGSGENIHVVALTGDDAIRDSSFCAFYKISGNNFYELMNKAAKSISHRYNTVKLRTEKELPGFVDCFGWCTWDSFYDKVTAKDVEKGLESFKAGGFVPKFLILDDGWQSVRVCGKVRGEWKLSSFRPNEKFNHNLRETVSLAKEKYGVERFFVWHAVGGYWGGVDIDSSEMQKYNPVLSNARHTDELKEANPTVWNFETFDYGIIDAERAGEFYDDYHSYLKNEGVDGVKIDVQGTIVGHANGKGGRKHLTHLFRNGIETSVHKNFNCEMINCMSCNNDNVYNVQQTNVMRSSHDFFPDDKTSHFVHVYSNALNSIWMSEFTYCDWDMFQTKHEYAQYHGAARAISGGPIYVSDKVDEHDFDLIDKLTLSDGKIFKAENVARLTVDCLFSNPIEEKKPFKIFNKNKYNGVVGVFATGCDEPVAVSVSPADIDGYCDGNYAVYRYGYGFSGVIGYKENINVTIKDAEYELVYFVPINDCVAAIGLADKMNGGAAVTNFQKNGEEYLVTVSDKGNLLLYSEKDIDGIRCNGKALPFTSNNGLITVTIPNQGSNIVITCI